METCKNMAARWTIGQRDGGRIKALIFVALCFGAIAQRAQGQPAPAANTCELQLTVPDDAKVTINDVDYGAKRKLEYKPLKPGKQYVLKVKVRFPDGGEAQRVIFIEGGKVVRRAELAPSKMVYAVTSPKNRAGIYSMNPDGTGVKRLTRSFVYSLDMSPDGSQVAFVPTGAITAREIRLVNVDGTNERRLTAGYNPRWSPDSQTILHSRRTSSRTSEGFAINVDGTGLRKMPAVRGPAWSPDGSRIAFVKPPPSRSGAEEEICTMDARGGDIRKLTNFQEQKDNSSRLELGTFPDVKWSPKGTEIAFVCSLVEGFRGTSYVFTMDPDGDNWRRLSQGSRPLWSPDGKKVLFYRLSRSNDPARGHYVVNADASGAHRLNREAALRATELGTPSWAPNGARWSPDGSKIALMATVDKDYDEDDDFAEFFPDTIASYIFVFNADGNGFRKVAYFPQQDIKQLDWR